MMDSSQVELPTLGDLELPEDTQLPTEAPEVPEELAEVEAPIEVAPASGEVHADVAEVSGSATQASLLGLRLKQLRPRRCLMIHTSTGWHRKVQRSGKLRPQERGFEKWPSLCSVKPMLKKA